MNLIAFIGEKTSVRIAAADVMLANFDTIDAIVATVDRARCGRGAGSA
jgi:hypothetical protein